MLIYCCLLSLGGVVLFAAPLLACGDQGVAAQAAASGTADIKQPAARAPRAAKSHTKAKPVAVDQQGGQREGQGEKQPAPSQAQQAIQLAVDFETLKTRLKHTDAIGFFTKIAIRNDIIDLLDEIRRYRTQRTLQAHISQIRASFDGLLLKIVALLEDDPELSRDLYVGRESIWKSLLEVKA